MRTPDFVIVGAHRCGTTSLYRTLKRHPGIQLPRVKEPHFFIADEAAGWRFANRTSPMPDLVTEWTDYLDLFADTPEHVLTGEASVLYLPQHRSAIPAMVEHLDRSVRIIISVRDPADRAYSAYLYNRESYESETAPSFSAALARARDEGPLEVPTLDYLALSRYAEGVAAFQDAFDHVHVVRFEELMDPSGRTLRDLFSFLGLEAPDDGSLADTNQSGWMWSEGMGRRLVNSGPAVRGRRWVKSVSPATHRVMHGLARRWLAQPAPALSAADRALCIEQLRDDIAALEGLTGWDLSCWRALRTSPGRHQAAAGPSHPMDR